MGVDHGGFYVAVAQEFLDGADVVAAFKKMGGEAVAEGVAAGAFGHSGGEDCIAYGALDYAVIHIVSALVLGAGVGPAVLLGEYPLPGPFAGGVWVFPFDAGR